MLNFPKETHDINTLREGTCIGISHDSKEARDAMNLPCDSIIEQRKDGSLFALLSDETTEIDINKDYIKPFFDTDLDNQVVKNVFILEPSNILIVVI